MHRANVIIDKLREHLTDATENLIAEQAENVLLTETIQRQSRAISELAAQLQPMMATAHLGDDTNNDEEKEEADV